MQLADLARRNGVTFHRCTSEWGGTWGYGLDGTEYNGYATKKQALRACILMQVGSAGLQMLEAIMEENARLKKRVQCYRSVVRGRTTGEVWR